MLNIMMNDFGKKSLTINMECNREEAERALQLAEDKFKTHDLLGAKKLALKAQTLCPSLPTFVQVTTAYGLHIAAATKKLPSAATKKLPSGATDWRAVLGVGPTADHEAIKKQFKRMCILTHPDKNKSAAADGAFKIVMQAWDVLSAPGSSTNIQKPGNCSTKPSGTNSSQWENLRALISCSQCRVDFVWAFKRSRCTHNLYYYCKKCSTWTLISNKPALSRATLACSCGVNLRWGNYGSVLCECHNCKNQCDIGVDPNWFNNSETPMAKQPLSKPSSLACPYCGAWNKYLVDKDQYSIGCKTCDKHYMIQLDSNESNSWTTPVYRSSSESVTLACPYCGAWDNYFANNNKYSVDCKTCGTRSIMKLDESSSIGSDARKRKR